MPNPSSQITPAILDGDGNSISSGSINSSTPSSIKDIKEPKFDVEMIDNALTDDLSRLSVAKELIESLGLSPNTGTQTPKASGTKGYKSGGTKLSDLIGCFTTINAPGINLDTSKFISMSDYSYTGDTDLQYIVPYKVYDDLSCWANVPVEYGYRYQDEEIQFCKAESAPVFKVHEYPNTALPVYSSYNCTDTSGSYYLRYNGSYVQYKVNDGSWTNLDTAYGVFLAMMGGGGGGSGACGVGEGVRGMSTGGGGGGGGGFLIAYLDLKTLHDDYPSAYVLLKVGAGGSGASAHSGSGESDASSGGDTTATVYYSSDNYEQIATAKGGGGGYASITWDFWSIVSDWRCSGGNGGGGSTSTKYACKVSLMSGQHGGAAFELSDTTYAGDKDAGDGGSYSNTLHYDFRFFDTNQVPFVRKDYTSGSATYYRGAGSLSRWQGTANYRSAGGGGGATVAGGKYYNDGYGSYGYGTGGRGGCGVANTFAAELYGGEGGRSGFIYILSVTY